MRPRKIDPFEIELNRTETGRAIVEMVRVHAKEILMLINHNRSVKVVWHRNHGPEFIASALRSGYEDDYFIEAEIEGVTVVQLLRRMAAALLEIGSPDLRKMIGTHYAMVMHWAQRHQNLRAVFNEIAELDAAKTQVEGTGLA